MKKNVLRICKLGIFLLIGFMIWGILSCIVRPKWYYPNKESSEAPARTISGFYNLDENTLDCIILGKSNVSEGLYVDRIYEKNGICCYDLGTCDQPLEVSYYLLEEALKTQHPKVVVLDVGGVFKKEVSPEMWRTVMDEFKFSKTKLDLIIEYKQHFNNEEYSTLVSKLLRYHDRWKFLTREDFIPKQFVNRHYFTNGTWIRSTIGNAVEPSKVNDVATQLLKLDTLLIEKYTGGDIVETSTLENQQPLYDYQIYEENKKWIEKINNLCSSKNVEFLLTKIPCLCYPQDYSSAWTYDKYVDIKNYCNECGYNYFDILYDGEMDIDILTDFADEGRHFNLIGGEKASDLLGDFLIATYNINENRNERWDYDLNLYKKIRQVASLQMEYDFSSYLAKLAEISADKLILMSACDDMSVGITEKDRNALKNFGCNISFDDSYSNSYIGVIEDGEWIYECKSNREQRYADISKNGINYNIYSSGWYNKSSSSILINGEEESINFGGLNIVVYDKKSGLILDKVCFDLFYQPNERIIKRQQQEYLLREYEYYLIEGRTTKED